MLLVGIEDKKSIVRCTDVKMQYNTVGRDRKGSVTSVANVSSWFFSLRRVGKKSKSPQKFIASSRSDWDLSTLTKTTPTKWVCYLKNRILISSLEKCLI